MTTKNKISNILKIIIFVAIIVAGVTCIFMNKSQNLATKVPVNPITLTCDSTNTQK